MLLLLTSQPLLQLPHILAHRPLLHIKINIWSTSTRSEFRERMLVAGDAYRQAWHRIKSDTATAAQGERREFFFMDYQYYPRLDEVPGGNGPPFYLKGTFRYARATDSFVCEITEARNETQSGSTVLEEAYAVGEALSTAV